MNWWHRLVQRTPPEEDLPEESVVGCRSTIIPPPPSGKDSDSPATLRVPRVPQPANDLQTWTADTFIRELVIDEDIGWEEQDSSRETRRREEPFRAATQTWKCRVA